MNKALNFEEIRPYYDNEVSMAIDQLINELDFIKIVKYFFPTYSLDTIVDRLKEIFTIHQFQDQIISPIVHAVIKSSTDGLTWSGLEALSKNENYLYISNHRDIILDSAFLNIILHKNNFNTTEIAIGSNLLVYPWITTLVKLNRSFIVNRNAPPRQLYEFSQKLSSYIRFALNEKKTSIWIAQREGRTKTGDDRTQPSLIKMLNISGSKDLVQNFKQLNIVPVSISYQIEPCAAFKVKEIYSKAIDPNYKKTIKDDLINMSKGLQSPKGKVHLSFGTPLNDNLSNLESSRNHNEIYNEIALLIDKQIHQNFILWPENYIAYDMLFETNQFKEKYSETEKNNYKEYLNKQLSHLRGDFGSLYNLYLKINALPVKNMYKL
jgi:1-acyl-sn-glycerol-3-phosphate acyltransferase